MSGVIEWVLFLSLSLITIVMAAGMLLTMSMYRAGLALMASFVALAGMFILLGADLLAAIQIMMNVGGMLVMVLFMVMMMMDPGGEMMWAMKRDMHIPGPGAFSMHMPWSKPRGEQAVQQQETREVEWTCPTHPEVSHPGPGTCPKCSMSLIPHAEAGGEDTSHEPSPGAHEQRYTCPMHPEVQQTQPGTCPKCSMTLVPVETPPPAQAQASETTVYTCPMHLEVQQTQPGKCAKCGMSLIPTEENAPSHEPQEQQSMSMQHTVTADHAMPVEMEGEGSGTGSSEQGQQEDGTQMNHADMNTTADTMQMPGHDMSMSGMGHSNHETQMAGHTMDMSHGMNMSGMTPGQYYQMMVDMAMSTAQLPWAIILGIASALLLIALVVLTPWPLAHSGPTQDATTAVGELLLSRYMIGFEGAAFLILAGIAGAVILAQRERGPEPTQPEHAIPVTPTLPEQEYTCPMHPEVGQSQPGTCPKCSMTLVPVENSVAASEENQAHAGRHGEHEAQREHGRDGGYS